jgi:Recombinase
LTESGEIGEFWLKFRGSRIARMWPGDDEMRELRDEIEGPVSLDYFHKRTVEGWKLKAVEWERADEAAANEPKEKLNAPYGIEVVPDTARLQPKTDEVEVLKTILEMIVVEKGVSQIADDLNGRGFTMRGGKPWNSSAVFNLLPRLIEAAPDILKRDDWHERRKKAVS